MMSIWILMKPWIVSASIVACTILRLVNYNNLVTRSGHAYHQGASRYPSKFFDR